MSACWSRAVAGILTGPSGGVTRRRRKDPKREVETVISILRTYARIPSRYEHRQCTSFCEADPDCGSASLHGSVANYDFTNARFRC